MASVEKPPALALLAAFSPSAVTLLTVLAALAVLPASALAQAQLQAPAPAQVPPEVLAQGLALATQAALGLAPPQARVVIQTGTLDPRLSLAPCARVEAYLPTGTPVWGRTRLGLRCAEGRVRWNVLLPLTVQVFAPAMVAAAAVPAGVPLTEALLQRTETDWASATSPLFEGSGPLLGRSLSRPLAAGQAVPLAHLQSRQWFAAGDTVRIQAAGNGFSVAGEGQALGPGLEGKAVRVQTGNGRVLVAKPVSERCVEVVL